MDELKAIFAANLIRLRTQAGLTQAELGKQLNYSDKTVSKWERADAVPDAFVLKKLGEIFGVTVDYLLSGHDDWQPPAEKPGYSREAIAAVTVSAVWTAAVLLFTILWITGHMVWFLLPLTATVTVVLLLVFNSLWNQGKGNMFLVMALVLAVALLIYLAFFRMNMWQLFLVLIPAELMVYFSFRIVRRNNG